MYDEDNDTWSFEFLRVRLRQEWQRHCHQLLRATRTLCLGLDLGPEVISAIETQGEIIKFLLS